MSSKTSKKQQLFASVEAPAELRADATAVIKPCVLCGKREARRLYMQAHFPVIRCVCGMVYADEHFREEDLAAFYSGDYYQRAYVCHPPEIDGKIARDYVRAFDRVDRMMSGGRVLDFGSARGTFLKELGRRGYGDRWQLQGLDINPDEVAMGRAEGTDIIHGTLETSGISPGSLDAVTAFSVIEHLQDPLEIMKQIAGLLRPKGRFLAIVPAGDCLIIHLAVLASRVLGDRVRGFTDNVFHEEHLYYFTRHSFTRLMEAAGLRTLKVFHSPSYLETHPPGLLVSAGAYGLRAASFLTRRQTMLGLIAEKI